MINQDESMSPADATPARPHGVLSWIRAHLDRLRRDRTGVAAIEFAFVAPVLLVTYFMTMEISQGLEVSKKTGRIAIIVGDLVTQQQSLNKADLDAIMRIGEAVMQLELTDSPVLVFRNEKHSGINVVYKRDDGNFGWIDPRNIG